MKTLHIATLLFCTSFLFNCGSEEKKNSENCSPTATIEEPEKKTMQVPEGPFIKLSGMYATSTMMPHSKNNLAAVFDNDENTYWATMPGAGPDEGFMLYFAEKQAIGTFEVLPATGDNFSTIETMDVYINGVKVISNAEPGAFKIFNDNVSSLYVRIGLTKDAKRTYNDDNGLASINYPAGKSVAIAEINIINEGKEHSVLPVKAVGGSITASSTLSPATAYGVRNLFDAKKEFAWAEGAKSKGEGETLTFTFDESQTISGLQIANGFQRSEKHFNSNASVKSFTVSDKSGNTTSYVLDKTQGVQKVTFKESLKTKELILTIDEVYPGTAYPDLVISELLFIGESGNFIIADSQAEATKKALLAKARDTYLESILDRRIHNALEEPEGFDKSIILRSDYTFVAYNKEWAEYSDESNSSEVIADGSWEIKEINGNEVSIRVFGKLRKVSTRFVPYEGTEKSDATQIFQDFVTITANELSGQKFMGTYQF